MMIRIAILCNDRLCLPAVQWLLGSGLVVAVGMPDSTHETRTLVQQLCTTSKVPFTLFQKKELPGKLAAWLQQYAPELVLVKTFPWLIPEDLLFKPPHGFINFHYAPLPHWRGANPLFWMIRQQASVGGVTVHIMDAQFDTGPVLLQETIPITPETTYGLLCTQLAYLGLQLTVMVLEGLLTGKLQATPQSGEKPGWYARPGAGDLIINWTTMPADSVLALIRACNPWNKGAATSYAGWMFGITEATIMEQQNIANANGYSYEPGTIVEINEQSGLLIACMDGRFIRADVVYCEEGFYTGSRLSAFGLKKNEQLGQVMATATPVTN